MIHFRNKTDIVDWLEKNCPRRAIVRALREGQVELLGGFTDIPPAHLDGWIIRVTSVRNKTWNVVITAGRELQIRILYSVPWHSYVGDEMVLTHIVTGDDPERYKVFKHEAKKRMANNSRSTHVSSKPRSSDQQATAQGMGEEG
ncbi:hypothetical protein LCGC14_0356240 [marine sediment metagenome]|uniref:Uncharacterized protein n=1 Tax=marine sediment metagenome TaxID=412755 RepID=A0A0F9TSF6_9ZZZZ